MHVTQLGQTEIIVDYLEAWHSTNGGELVPFGAISHMQKVIVAVTQTQYGDQKLSDRAALIVTAYDTGVVLWKSIVEKDWEYSDKPLGSVANCTITFLAELPAPEGNFGDVVYETHWFKFDQVGDRSRFHELIVKGQELASSYAQALQDVLIDGILERGVHRAAQ